MAQPLTEALYAEEFDALLAAERWTDALSLFEQGLDRAERDDPEHALAYSLALIRSGRIKSGVGKLTAEQAALPGAASRIRRLAITWLLKEKRFAEAAELASRLIEAHPDDLEHRRLRASILGRGRQYEPAIADAEAVVDADPLDWVGQEALLQLRIQDGRLDDAVEQARVLGADAARTDKLAWLALLAMIRSRRKDEAVALANAIDAAGVTGPEGAGAVLRAWFEGGEFERAVTRGEAYFASGFIGPKSRHYLGQAHMVSGHEGAVERAIEILAPLSADPKADPLSLGLYGEALLRLDRSQEAIDPLSKAVKAQPKVPHLRAMYARALKQAGAYGEAAREFQRLVSLQPESQRWRRFAAGALSQAGRRKEAAELFDEFVAERRETLPDQFEAGLDALWDKVDEVKIPSYRLDWAWGLRKDDTIDRAEWERRAKWGHLADHYLLDWLECRDDRIHEPMSRLADLNAAEQALGSVDMSRGAMLVSAHIGPMYAGPLALELLGVRSQWLASTPSVARTAYARNLISTADQPGNEVGRRILWSLREGNAVVIAIDGAINLAAPRVMFEGQEITYSSFVSRMAHRYGTPTLFVAPRWKEGAIDFVVEPLPGAREGEEVEAYVERWKDAYLDELRRYLSGDPENLRLSGGIWRYIGPSDGSDD